MNSLLFKLRFTTAVHFGPSDSALSLYSSAETFCADTLFSALCHTAMSLWGVNGLQELCSQVRAGSLAGGDAFEPRRYSAEFGRPVETTRACVADGEDTVPYAVGTFMFAPDHGLYILALCADEQQAGTLRTLLEALGVSGIGGKVTSGCGRFVLDDEIDLDAPFDDQTEWLSNALSGEHSHYLLVTASLPRDDELDETLAGASFALVRRGGFVQSDTYAHTARKKRTQYFLASGSVLTRRFDGDLYEVGGGGAHPVYRYGCPVLLGVDL